jgi:hypothetical protein
MYRLCGNDEMRDSELYMTSAGIEKCEIKPV